MSSLDEKLKLDRSMACDFFFFFFRILKTEEIKWEKKLKGKVTS